ncbi:MAG TPA: L,D-transpeptidase family protein [Ramlibacter sp.]|uniref:L,D-transpeptidase family protein n=1 Tax=Ramlibacter sp. TaxID=1917967 RepID=UPI002D504BA7|nr:L,D-transpeptidase family protein [Ramlibacter sp.]HZY19485.1 L,D-transpeptidase family protein [Ramlibacter sp.]
MNLRSFLHRHAGRAAALLAAASVLAIPPALAASQARHKDKPPRAAAAAPRQVVRDGEAEARLLEVYRLIGAGEARRALVQAESLVREHPNFQLAQLVYGDLLTAQTRPVRSLGDVPDALGAGGAQLLAELREESQLRIRALRERPPAGAIPSQFLQLSPRSRHAIAVDTSRARLYLFENGPSGLKLLADYYISVGRSGIDKAVEGDLRTPLGVYYVTSNLDPKSLKDFYGVGALPINYPNPYDARRGKTGGGIWLHGTPPAQFSRAPKATDGCVVLANPDLDRIIRTVEVRTTPVVIASSLRWVAPQALQADARPFADTLAAWRAAKASGDINRTLSFYTPDMSANGRPIADWLPQLKTELERARGRELELKDLSYLRWTDSADTMVVTFGEVPAGARTGPIKRQYWMRQGQQWKIFFEGVIG